jgi:PGF-CTERM protein
MAGAAGTVYGIFDLPPGTVRTIAVLIKADESARRGQHTLQFSGLYYPGDNKDLYNQISLTYPITVKEASKKPESAEPSNPKDVSKSAATPAPTPPGFEAIFAIAALLAVAYLVGRKK